MDICPKADFPQPPADRQRVRAVIDRVRGGGAISEVILSGHQRSGWRHLGRFRYS